ncbi:adenosylcobinamide-GDP ribazoletransferase [Paraglaciecola sp. 2405UD69-4]|uniref:adenosylcobinamide-GDP ribazoletransferase n=1 Tax=Paraglaciecola sp. 2405UD69-4 TaxID=3391836 RepID=UPI0039C913CA
MIKWLQYQLNLFLLALSFFSRLPMAKSIQYSPSKMRRSSRYFPMVGWLLALMLSITYWLLVPYLGSAPSLCFIMVLSLLSTGALHEDGLADTCDGIWGGHTTERKLAIMKDSRIGTYGSCGLIMALLSKFTLLSSLAGHNILEIGLLIAYPLSRAMAITLVQDMQYVSNQIPTTGSKSEPLAKPFSFKTLCFVLASGALACLFLPLTTSFYIMCGCLVLRYWLKYWLNKHIQGYTGDSLGTAQQLQELLIYTIILANAH